jgi:hypothetical protein
MLRSALNLTIAIMVAIGGACTKSADQRTRQRGDQQPRRTTEQRFAEFDKNKDGKLSMQEYRGKATKTEHFAILDKDFRAADSNHDGFLSLDEYKNSQGSGRGGGRGFGRNF